MTASLRVFCQSEEEGGSIIRMAGVIDETFDRSALALSPRGVVFDLDEVHRITSYGVREWVRAMAALPVTYFGFVRCRPAVLAQFNMVSGFAGRGELLSFYAPYICAACANEFQVLIDLRTDTPVRSLQAPSAECPACRSVAELDDIADSYFSFAASQARPSPPEAIGRLVERASESVFRVEKEVVGSVTALWLHGNLDRTSRLKRAVDGLEGVVVLVAAGLESVNPDGLVALDMVAKTPGAEVHLARVGSGPLAVIAASDVADRLRIVSVQPPVTCGRCGDVTTVELFKSDVATLPPCRKCDAPYSLQPESLARDLARVTLIPAPDGVRDYLASQTITPWSRSL